jgi:DNA processing protein
MTTADEREALVALLRYTAASKQWRRTAMDVVERGSAIDALTDEIGNQLFDATAELTQRARVEISAWEAKGIRVLSFFDEDYPGQLRDVHDSPPLVFARGSVVPDDVGVCLVGSRDASREGLHFAADAAAALVDDGVTVVSGLAKGIDTAAHTTALEQGGRTVAVIGTGVNKYYPAENRSLQLEVEEQGLVLSQFWPESPPTRSSFPMRNATMSAYGEATVVVEAGERSGARIQARQAIEHGRALILAAAVVRSTHWGADLAKSAGDIHIVEDVQQMLTVVRNVLSRRQRLNDLLETPR